MNFSREDLFLLKMRVVFIVFACAVAAVEGVTECYGELGCFDSDEFFDVVYRPTHRVPESRSDCNVKFYLHTRSYSADSSYQELKTGDKSTITAFQPDKDTKIIVHGYNDDGSKQHYMQLKDALLQAGDFNVISVNWEDGADGFYDQAAVNTWVAGGEIALLITFLLDQTSTTTDRFHVIGLSLGSHVAGYAGARHTNPKLARITALDPADPLFTGMPASVRIDETDADFVDVIHTDGNNLILGLSTFEGGFGMADPVGHIDFYVNGGKEQPGCDENIFIEIFATITGNLEYVVCDHVRALYLMIDSVTASCDMKSFPCDSYDDFKDGKCSTCGDTNSECGIVGYKADQAKPPAGQVNVKHYLMTGPSPQYCRSHLKVTVKLSSSSDDERGYLQMKIKASNGYFEVKIDPDRFESGQSYSTGIELADVTLGEFTELEIWYQYQYWLNPFGWGNHDVKLDNIEVVEFGSSSVWFCANGMEMESEDHHSIYAAENC